MSWRGTCLALLVLSPLSTATRAQESTPVVLFDGEDLDSFLAVGDTAYVEEEWILDGALGFEVGARDLITREGFADVHLSLEFRLEEGVDTGIFLGDRWEIVLADSAGRALGPSSCGALRGQATPRVDACGPVGTWQRLDVAYSHRAGEDPRATVWIDDQLVLDRVVLGEPTWGGARSPLVGSPSAAGVRFATQPGEPAPDMGRPFSLTTRFRSRASGTLVSKCPRRDPGPRMPRLSSCAGGAWSTTSAGSERSPVGEALERRRVAPRRAGDRDGEGLARLCTSTVR